MKEDYIDDLYYGMIRGTIIAVIIFIFILIKSLGG